MIELALFRRATRIFILVMNINVQLPKITSARTTFVNWRVGIQMPTKVNPSTGGWDKVQEKLNDFPKDIYFRSGMYIIIWQTSRCPTKTMKHLACFFSPPELNLTSRSHQY